MDWACRENAKKQTGTEKQDVNQRGYEERDDLKKEGWIEDRL